MLLNASRNYYCNKRFFSFHFSSHYLKCSEAEPHRFNGMLNIFRMMIAIASAKKAKRSRNIYFSYIQHNWRCSVTAVAATATKRDVAAIFLIAFTSSCVCVCVCNAMFTFIVLSIHIHCLCVVFGSKYFCYIVVFFFFSFVSVYSSLSRSLSTFDCVHWIYRFVCLYS